MVGASAAVACRTAMAGAGCGAVPSGVSSTVGERDLRVVIVMAGNPALGGSRTQTPATSGQLAPGKRRTSWLKAAGCSRLGRCAASGMTACCALGTSRESCAAIWWKSATSCSPTRTSVGAQPQTDAGQGRTPAVPPLRPPRPAAAARTHGVASGARAPAPQHRPWWVLGVDHRPTCAGRPPRRRPDRRAPRRPPPPPRTL
jgi:hypothetical protein